VAVKGERRATLDRQRARLRSLLAASATITLGGIVLSVSGDSTIGGVVTVAALVSLIWCVHRLGRTGPDGVTDPA